MNRLHYLHHIFHFGILTVVIAVCCAGCNTTKYVPEGDYLLDKVSLTCDDPLFNTGSLNQYIHQQPNSKLFSLVRLPLAIYSLSGQDDTKWNNKVLRRIGQPPVLYDSLLTSQTCDELQRVLFNMGYMHGAVESEKQIDGKKLSLKYVVHPTEQFVIGKVNAKILDADVKQLLDSVSPGMGLLRPGSPFSISMLNNERKRVSDILTRNGYYKFNKEFIEFDVDTAANSNDVNINMILYPYKSHRNAPETNHVRYRINSINYLGIDSSTIPLRHKYLVSNTAFSTGDYFNSENLQKTYNNFSRLQAVRYTNISFTDIPGSDDLLDCNIHVSTNKPSSISFQPEGTNTAGDLGAAASVSYENCNLFHGSEQFSLKFRAAFEAITGLEGYQDQDYQEYTVESKLLFPRLLVPLMPKSHRLISATTSELAARYELQNRPEFHRRVFSGVWRYRWNSSSKRSAYRFDLLDMNYIYMPWISETFKHEYLDNDDNRNAILRYNYEDLFIMKIGFGYNYSNHDFAIRTNIETSGNALELASNAFGTKRNANEQHTLFSIAFAQYVKGDIDVTKQIVFDEVNNLVFHAALGIAYPYGNSKILPFEKRYFTGGANSLRGWSVRGLGPGGFRGTDGRIDFINQTGDMKLDLSMEYRTKIFWKLNGAAFIDAGNIWTIRDYDNQPNGQFRFDSFYKQIAVSYGLGVRFNLGYFVLRLDCGMKAINPAYTTNKEHYPIIHPDFGRDFALHFAVGMPF